MLSRKLSALVALSLVTASSAAAAQSAQSLSLANSPGAASRTSELENRGNGYGVYIIGALVIAAIVYGIIKLTDNNNNPSSP
jgi:hypothetical protein